MMKLFSARRALILGLTLYLLLALAHSTLAPLTTGPDELAHYEYVDFIATHHRLPLTYAERAQAGYKSDQPPLFHLITAIPASFVPITPPTLLKRDSDSPRRALIERTRHAWGLYNTLDETWPYRGEVLRWHIGRWGGIAFGLMALTLSFFMAAAVLKDESLALATAMTIGFIPRFILTGSMLNYETLTLCLATLAWGQLWQLSQSTQWKNRSLVLLGLWVGLTILAKLSAIILLLEIVLALSLMASHQAKPWPSLLHALALTALGCLLVLSIWFGFVIYQFNTISQEGGWAGVLRPLIAADGSDATTNQLLHVLTHGEAGFVESSSPQEAGSLGAWLLIFYRTFWAVSIETHQPLGSAPLIVLGGVILLALYGLKQPYTTHRLTVQLLALHSVLPLVLPLTRFVITGSLADSAQGRHLLFLAAPTLAILLIWGLSAFRFLYPSLPAFLLCWTLAQIGVMRWAYSPPLPVSLTPLPVAHTLKHPFTDSIELLGYETQQTPTSLQVDLMWHATDLSPVDYLTEISLLDSQGEVKSRWQGYTTNGRYPSRAWDTGDFIRDTAWLPLAGLAPGPYQVSVTLHPMNLAAPTPTAPLLLTPLELAPAPPPTQTHLWQSGQVVTHPTFRDREVIMLTAPLTQSITLLTAQHTFSQPLSQVGHVWLFLVNPDWPSGEYQVADTPLTFHVSNTRPRSFTAPPMSHRVEANFANQVKLLGYDLPTRRVSPGGELPLTLYWQGLDWLSNDYTIFIKPLALANQTAYGGRDRLPREDYRTLYWSPNEIITDAFAVPIAPNAPPGLYQLHIGLYHEVNGQAHYLPLIQNNRPPEVTSITLGPVKVGTMPSEFRLTAAQPYYPLTQTFGDNADLTLLGYDLTRQSTDLTLRFYWQCNAPLPLDYTLFVHLRNDAGQTIAQHDQPPTYPTGLWDAGEIIPQDLTLPLPPDLPAGHYTLAIGFYDFNTGQRLTIPHQPDNSLTLSTSITMK